MEDKLPSEPPCYVFDASSLIELEGPNRNGLNHMPDRPGRWLVIPSKVAKETNSEGAPADTKNWLRSGKLSTFNVDSEHKLFIKILVEERLLSDADVQGIVIAHHRKGTYVVEEGLATRVAKRLGVRTINAKQFSDKVRPHLL
ncbi:MAG: hypothetical protein IMY77_00090 [Chloroflexi bacterium]|nr:hypothetical protein [Chloroflexota bacterium]